MTPITSFATSYRLKLRGDLPDEKYVQGRAGLITEYSSTRLHLVLSPGTGNAGWWNNRRRAAVAVGMTLDADGDSEGSLIFDPTDAKQAAAVIKLSRSRQRRIVSESQRSVLLARLHRRNSPVDGTAGPEKPTIAVGAA